MFENSKVVCMSSNTELSAGQIKIECDFSTCILHLNVFLKDTTFFSCILSAEICFNKKVVD